MPEPVKFEGTTPILRVADLAVSLDYYVRVLGFQVRWEAPGFVCVARDRCSLFLCEGDQGHPGSWVWIGVEDAAALFAEYLASGAVIRHPPTNYDWAYEMQIADPDGNVLRMGSDSRDNEPLGEFLDMKGNRWSPQLDGKWLLVPGTQT